MKKLFFVVFISTFFTFELFAQKPEFEIGFMINPQGEISLKHPEHGFDGEIPLFALLSVKVGEFSVTPIYNITGNSVGGFLKFFLPKEIGFYGVGLKKIHNTDTYLATGIDFPIAKGFAGAFLEIGSWYKEKEWEPSIAIGVSIPLTVKL